MSVSYISHPSRLFRRLLRPSVSEFEWYRYGQLSIGLEIVTQIKSLESLPVVSELGRQEAVSALTSLLMDMDLYDDSVNLYERLSETRRLSFEAVVSGEPKDQVHEDHAHGEA